MKKFLVVLLSIFSFVAIAAVSNNASAAELVDEDIVTNGDFGELSGELPFGDPVFGPEFGPAVNWGSGNWDSHVVACVDPLNENNTVIRYANTKDGLAFCSFFHFVKDADWNNLIKPSTTYEISVDYMVVGATDNFGMRFAGSPACEKVFYSGSATDGWQTATWEWTTAENANYDSIAIWMNTANNAENIGYIDNIVVKEKETGVNLVPTGNFEGFLDNVKADLELPFGDPVFGEDFGPAFNWGSGNWDSNVVAVADPLDSTNTVIRYGYTKENLAWCSFFKFCKLLPNTTYEISVDYMVVGATDNFGMRFAGSPACEKVFYGGESTDGWQTATWEWTTAENANYDSIAIWMNTASNKENLGYIDNIVVKVKGTDENVIVGGDFEGFLDYAPTPTIPSEEADIHGNTSENASYGNGNLVLGAGWFHQDLGGAYSAGKYQIGLDYSAAELADKNLSIQLVDDEGTVVDEIKLVEAGVDAYNGQYLATITASGTFYGVKVVNSGAEVQLDNLSIRPVVDYPFDEDKTYYQSESMTVNGDFEKFEVGTVFSEEQQEGAWGSVSLDNPATIQDVNGSHVIDLTAGSKTYSSAFLMLPDTLEAGDMLRLTYDVKLVLSAEASEYTAIDSCLVGGSNVSYYTINYKSLDLASESNRTSGAEVINYFITITEKENGWYNVSFDFQLTNRDLIQTNSLRFLFTAKSAEDHMYIDNVNLYSLSETPFDTSVKVQSIAFNDGASVNMTVGDEKTLGYTINPSDATDKSVTFTSSNESVATVDANGKVVAVGKGACTVTVTAANGVKAEIAILVAEKAAEPAKGCWGSVGASILGVIALAGAAFVVAKRKKD